MVQAKKQTQEFITEESNTNNDSTKDFIQIKKSNIWPIICSILVISLFVAIFTKDNSNKNELTNKTIQNIPATPSQISPNGNLMNKTDTATLPNDKNYDHFIKKMIYVKYFDQLKNELLMEIGYVIESGGKQFVLTTFDTSYQGNNILEILAPRNNKTQTTTIDILGVAFPGTTAEKKFPLKPSNVYYDRIIYLEPLENLSFLESFLFTDIKKLNYDKPVKILGFSANQFSSLQKIFGKPKLVENEGKIGEDPNLRRNSLFIAFTLSPTIPCNYKLMSGFIVLNDKNEILGISEFGLFNPNTRFFKTLIDPVNTSRELILKNTIRNW